MRFYARLRKDTGLKSVGSIPEKEIGNENLPRNFLPRRRNHRRSRRPLRRADEHHSVHAGRQLLHHHVLLILTHILALTLAVMIVGGV